MNVHGIFLPTGHTSMQNHLLTTTYVDVMNIRRLKEKNTDVQVEASMLDKIQRYRQRGDFYSQLAASIAPEIFGHVDVKKPYYYFCALECHEGDKMVFQSEEIYIFV